MNMDPLLSPANPPGSAPGSARRHTQQLTQSFARLPLVTGHEGSFTCWICMGDDSRDNLLRPCPCAEYVHRECLERWRFSSVNPTAHARCSNCKYAYKFGTSLDSDKFDMADRNHKRGAWKHILKFWVLFLLILFLGSAGIGTLAYLCDTGKNIPTVLKFTAVAIFGKMPDESMSSYREDLREHFKEKHVAVWPQYLCFGFLLSCVGLSGVVLTFRKQYENNQRALAQQCKQDFEANNFRSQPRANRRRATNGCGDCYCSRDDMLCWYCWYGSSTNSSGSCNDCTGCSGASSGGGDCKCEGDAAGVAIIIIVVALVLAAVAGLIFLVVAGLVFSKDIYSSYIQKQLDREQTKVGAVYVVDLEDPDLVVDGSAPGAPSYSTMV